MTQVFAMALFALTMSVSPGPVNIITLSTGLNHGAKSAIRFVSGATISFTLLLLFIGLGLQATADKLDGLLDIMTLLGAAIIVYFGYKMIISDGQLTAADHPAPGFWHGAALQWLNPKAGGACLAAVSIFSLEESKSELYAFVALYGVVCFAGIGSWAVFGSKINRWLNTAFKRSAFN